jgi:Spy/CpxP family protein refolding chaperone
MMRTTVKILLSIGLFATLALSQGMPPLNSGATPPDPQTMAQMRVNGLARILNLTDAQKTQATSIFTAAYTADESIRSSLQTDRKSLASAVRANPTGPIDTLAATIGNLEGQILAIDSKAEASFYAILTKDQQAIYDTMPGGGMRGPGGRGGPMRPGGRGL